jgi:hypothetical protein
MKLQNDDDVKAIFSIFSQYNTKGPIELYANLMRFVQDIYIFKFGSSEEI